MKSRSPSFAFTVALCASLTLHVLLFVFAERQYERSLWALGFDALAPMRAIAGVVESADRGPLVFITPPKPAVQLGRTDGTGAATDDSPGDEPMQAKLAEQDQPLLSRDPVGPGKMHDEPAEGLAPPAPEETPMVGAAAVAQVQQPMPQRPARHVEQAPDGEQGNPEVARDTTEQANSDSPTPTPADPTAMPQPAANTSGGAAAAGPPADPAPQGDSESAAFSSAGGVDFRGGKVEARLGRRHRITRPRINLAGMVDTVSLRHLALQMELRIDATGNVVAARIVQSCGSDQIDQACRLAAYEWWFEPRQGNASETFTFGIRFY